MVTKMAYNQIKCYGMSESLGHLSFDHNEESTFQKKPYSKRLAALIDEVSSVFNSFGSSF